MLSACGGGGSGGSESTIVITPDPIDAITDSALRTCVRNLADSPADIQTLDCPRNVYIGSLEGIEILVNLRSATLILEASSGESAQTFDFSALASLNKLEELKVDIWPDGRNTPPESTAFSGLATLNQLSSLKTLYFSALNFKAGTTFELASLSTIKHLTLGSYNLDIELGGYDLKGESSQCYQPIPLADSSALGALTQLETLRVCSEEITDISSLAALVNLTTLNLTAPYLTDISVLTNFTRLERLVLEGKNHDLRVTDFSAISSLPELHFLALTRTQFDDLTLLSSLNKLDTLVINQNCSSCNDINDISALSTLTSLKTLTLATVIGAFSVPMDLSPLAGMNQLQTLEIRGADLSLFSTIANHPTLNRLVLSHCAGFSIGTIVSIPNLQSLALKNTDCCGFTPLSDLTGLEQAEKLTWLSLRHNAVNNLHPVSALSNLVELDVFQNAIQDISPLATLQQLNILDASHNAIEDIQTLGLITSLEEVILDDNTISDAAVLATLPNLRNAQLNFNDIIDGTFAYSIVNRESVWLRYNPNLDCAAMLAASDGSKSVVSDCE